MVSAGAETTRQRSLLFIPEVHNELTRSWRSPYSTRLHTSASSSLTTVDGSEEKWYKTMPPSAIGWKAKAAHLSKSCRTTAALAGCSYALAGQAASALHSMAVLQIFQAKLLYSMDGSEPDPATLRELRSATDLALCATKTSKLPLPCLTSAVQPTPRVYPTPECRVSYRDNKTRLFTPIRLKTPALQ